MKLETEAIRGMLGFLAEKKGGMDLLLYICKHATDHEFRGNEEDWMFRQTVLQAKDILPDTFRISVWYDWCHRQRDLGGCPVHGIRISDCQALVDDVNVRSEYCRKRLAGYKMLLNIDRPEDRQVPQDLEWIASSADKDCVPQFGIAYSLHGGRFQKGIVWELARYNATRCLLWLMDECKDFFANYPAREMLCFSCANMRDEMGKGVIEYLAKRFPEKVAGCVDDLGNNPLWYLLHNGKIPWWRPDCGMVQALVKAGCSPDTLNHLGLSFRKMVDNLTEEHRVKLERQMEDNLDDEENPY